MVNIQELQHRPVSEIGRILGVNIPGYVPANLKQLGFALEVSVLPYNFDALPRSGETLFAAFVTNKEGRSCIFYNSELSEESSRIVVTKAFARYILTGNNSFYLMPSTNLSEREKRLTYELLMPEDEVQDVLKQLILPTTLSLANIFYVTQEFVRERLDDIRPRLGRMIGGYDF